MIGRPRDRYLLTATIAVLAGLVAGCGGDEESAEQNPPKVYASESLIESEPGLIVLARDPSSSAGPNFKSYAVSLDDDAPAELVERLFV